MAAAEKQLTDLEWEIMNHIWKNDGEVSVRDILEEAYSDGTKAYTTIQTVMNNLVDKGFLTKEKIGMVNFYQPVHPRDQVIRKEVHYFVDKVFRGSVPQFVKHFIDQSSLSGEEIAELKRFIEEKSEAGKDDKS